MSEPPLAPQVRARVFIPFVIVTLIWGSTWLVIRDQLGVVPASWSVTYRFIVASAAMFAYSLVTGTSLKVPRAAWGMVLLIGLPQFVLNFNLVYRAEAYITSGLVAVIFALLLVPNALLARIFLGQQLSRPFLFGSVIAMLGIGLLFAHELKADGSDNSAVFAGIGLTLLAILSASIANVAQAFERVRSLPMPTLLAWSMAVGATVNAAWAAITTGPPVFDLRAGYVAGILYLGLAASAFAFLLYYRIIREIGAARAAYSSVLVPIIAMGLSTVFEGYRWSATALLGGALTLAGLIFALRSRSPSR
ncbi:DMT family transporter [Sphingomonas sp. ID1715]|uniref:DMT family transporter n=1 Tax=Sphingomonas sp. ID1715 TaxID=1656898 RepID=UPI001488D562|nr:DMT family transporter [Sphingomonas sp. ID1715]